MKKIRFFDIAFFGIFDVFYTKITCFLQFFDVFCVF